MKGYAILNEQPESIIAYREGNTLTINFDYNKVEKPATTNTEEGNEQEVEDYYQYTTIRMKGASDYANIVSAIINDKYDANSVQAIIANYEGAKAADEPTEKDEEYLQEYAEYQAYRRHAKEIAKIVSSMKGV